MSDDNRTARPTPPSGDAAKSRPIVLPKPTKDQATYLTGLKQPSRREYDKDKVVGGPRRRKA